MKKIRIGLSVIFLLLLCLIFNNFLLMFNYLLALFLHEMAHLMVAYRRGYSLKQFKFDICGISLDLKDDVSDKDCFAVNIAGPALNLFICLVCLALYWLVPISYNYLNVFCYANLFLALFNLLPIYPLDGGKIFKNFISSDKMYKIIDRIVRIGFSLLFLILFIVSIFNLINWFYLIMVIFFLSSRPSDKPTLSILKFKGSKSIEKINLIKIEGQDNLFSLIKHIKKHRYTIFYYPVKKQYIDEDTTLEYALKYPLTTEIKDIKF